MTDTRPIAQQKRRRQRQRSGSLAIAGLLLLSALPVIGGALRLAEVADPGAVRPVSSPVAIVAHIVAMSLFCLIGAFQFSPALRIGSGWHRYAGRLLIPAGLIAGLSAAWLAVFFGGPPDEFALAMIRLVFAVAMTTFILQGVIAITRRDFTAHGAWMTRTFALAVTGGTQALASVLWALPFGEAGTVGETWIVAAGFVINSVVAQLIIRRRTRQRIRGLSSHSARTSWAP